MNYELDDLVAVAKRDNNTLRPYLYVNPLQGKHIPVKPSQALALYQTLAMQLEEKYKDERQLVIGFAETATAIGAGISMYCDDVIYCTQTTREFDESAQYVYFSESHSHAKQQSVRMDRLAQVLPTIDRIIFAEDEVTTGNTIEKLIHALEKQFPDTNRKYTIACILNSMEDDRIKQLKGQGVDCVYVARLPYEYHLDSINDHEYQGNTEVLPSEWKQGKQELFKAYADLRKLQDKQIYVASMQAFVQHVMTTNPIKSDTTSVLVLGTEEFMMPPLLLAYAIEQAYPNTKVVFHATTRSPILVSKDEAYPLHKRHQLESLYEQERITYVYNLTAYDQVFLVSDAPQPTTEGLHSILSSLQAEGCENITFIRWCEK